MEVLVGVAVYLGVLGTGGTIVDVSHLFSFLNLSLMKRVFGFGTTEDVD